MTSHHFTNHQRLFFFLHSRPSVPQPLIHSVANSVAIHPPKCQSQSLLSILRVSLSRPLLAARVFLLRSSLTFLPHGPRSYLSLTVTAVARISLTIAVSSSSTLSHISAQSLTLFHLFSLSHNLVSHLIIIVLSVRHDSPLPSYHLGE